MLSFGAAYLVYESPAAVPWSKTGMRAKHHGGKNADLIKIYISVIFAQFIVFSEKT